MSWWSGARHTHIVTFKINKHKPPSPHWRLAGNHLIFQNIQLTATIMMFFMSSIFVPLSSICICVYEIRDSCFNISELWNTRKREQEFAEHSQTKRRFCTVIHKVEFVKWNYKLITPPCVSCLMTLPRKQVVVKIIGNMSYNFGKVFSR